MLAGITAIQFAPQLPSHSPWLVAALLAAVPLVWRTRGRWLLFLLLGLIYATVRAGHDRDHALPARLAPLPVDAVIEVSSLVQWHGPSASFEAQVSRLDVPLPLRRLRVEWMFAPRELRAAQRWRLPLRLRCARGLRNPGGFDAEGWWRREGIDALASVQNRFAAERLADASGAAARLLRLREAISLRLTGFAAGSPSAGVIAGLAVGDTSQIPPEQWSLFRATGITHLMAISGAHVGMFGLFAAALTRRAWRALRPAAAQRGTLVPCALASTLGAGGYALLAGFSVPSQRTALMIAVAGAARLRARHLPPSHSLALALIAVLLLDPAAAIQPGFWLSFGTVAWIFASASGAAPAPALLADVKMQAGVSLLVLPATLYGFGQASFIAPLVNLVAVPVTGLLLVPAIVGAAALAAPLPGLSHGIIAQLAVALDHTWPWLSMVSTWPLAQHWTPDLPLAWAAGATGGALLATLAPWPWRAIGAAAMLGALSWRVPAPPAGGFEFTLLDAGDATLAAVLTRGSVLVYFAGAGSAFGPDVGASVLLPYLRSRGRERIDLLVLSRADGAHAMGLDAVFRELPVLQVIAGADRFAPCEAGQRFDRDAVDIRVLAPPVNAIDAQGGACVLLIAGARASVLLAADLDAVAERALLARQVLHPVSVALVPAHGSPRASSAEFIATVRPSWALVAAAHLNRFDYPRPEVLARWREAGAQVRQVSQEGAITLSVEPRGPAELPPGERIRHRRYWTVD